MPNQSSLSPTQILIMATAAGVAVANIYYNQPILKEISTSLHEDVNSVGPVSALSQVGYGLGLFFLVPLGDKKDRKRLILSLLSLLSLSLVGMVLAGSLTQVYVLSVLIGLLAVSPQILVPMAASLDPVNRGKTVGIIFSGILIGILAARVFSGFIAEWLGWRYVYGISACMVAVVAVLIQTSLPNVEPVFSGSYPKLLQSTLQQIRRFGLLRQSAVLGALVFGLFCSFWTTLTFHLSGAPFNFQSDKIGLFGLVAIAGAMAAPYFGKLADKGNARKSLLLTVSTVLFSILLMKLAPHSIPALVVAVLLLDVGVQATQITNVARIYTLDATAHSRINTIYMTTYFIGGSIGTAVGLKFWSWGGWSLVTWQLLAWAIIALMVVLLGRRTKIPS